jgi:hypothetical protein
MWAAAIVALAVGGPLGACLFLAAGITHALKVNKVDAEYAKRGELPPTARLVEGWLNRKKAAGTAPQSATVKPYGSWAYAKQRWQAMWEDLGEKHREQRAAHKAAVAEAKKNGTPLPVKPSVKERLAGWKWSIPNLIAPAKGSKKTAAPEGGPAPEPEIPNADGLLIKCDECGARLADADGGYQHPAGSDCPKASATVGKKTAPSGEKEPLAQNVIKAVQAERQRRDREEAATAAAPLGPGSADPAKYWPCQRCHSQYPHPAPPSRTCTTCALGGGKPGVPRWGVCGKCNAYGSLTTFGWCEPCVTSAGTAFCSRCHAVMVRVGDEYRHSPHQDCPAVAPVQTPNGSPDYCSRCDGPLTSTSRGRFCQRCDTVKAPSRPQPNPKSSDTNQQGDTMTTPTTTDQSGEVVGLQSAINFADTVAAAHAKHSTGGGEQYRASLGQAKVGAATIQSAARAQELSEMAGAAWKAHADKLREQLAAKEHTTAETGSKEFLLSD